MLSFVICHLLLQISTDTFYKLWFSRMFLTWIHWAIMIFEDSKNSKYYHILENPGLVMKDYFKSHYKQTFSPLLILAVYLQSKNIFKYLTVFQVSVKLDCKQSKHYSQNKIPSDLSWIGKSIFRLLLLLLLLFPLPELSLLPPPPLLLLLLLLLVEVPPII